MDINISAKLYNKLVERLGKETAVEVIEIVNEVESGLKEKVVEETKKRKIELRDELRKELATKEDIMLVRQEIETVRQELKGEIESLRNEVKGEIEALRQEIKGEIKVLKIMIFFLFALVIILNKESLELILKVFGLLK